MHITTDDGYFLKTCYILAKTLRQNSQSWELAMDSQHCSDVNVNVKQLFIVSDIKYETLLRSSHVVDNIHLENINSLSKSSSKNIVNVKGN